MPAKGNEMNAHFLSTRLTILLCQEKKCGNAEEN